MKKLLSVLLAALFVLGCACPVYADEPIEPTESGSFTLVNYNVDGLPIPKRLSKSGRDPGLASKTIGQKLHDLQADIYAVQEDFNFHSTVKKGIGAEYATLHNGGIPFGDGLNYFSSLPLYNVTRIPWDQSCGILTDGNDELTPKGFLCSSFRLCDGVYIDVYDIHADAYSGDGNTQARIAQYEQLLAFINSYSVGHAVIITGDFNSYFSQPQNKLYEIFVQREGFKEAWIEMNYHGNYDTRMSPPPEYHNPEWTRANHWGVWDSAEKMFYRSAQGVTVEPTQCDYIRIDDENGQMLSDHNAQIGTFTYTVNRDELHDTRCYETEPFRPLHAAVRRLHFFFKALRLICSELPKLISGEIKIKIDK